MRPFIVLAAFLAFPLLASDTYQIDPAHSEISFRVQHLGLSKVFGRFTNYQGAILLDDQDLSRSKVDVSIEAYSVNTESDARDKHLRSADFFDVARFPNVTFHSVSVKPAGKDRFDVTGDFTLHGVTRRLTLPMAATGTARTPKETRVGFEGTVTLNRSDYGMTYMPGIVGDGVAVTLGIEAVKAEAKP
ncbi:MAG TPA: YceI family protein [Holophaga sp.]|nr:YceI family protein [Holophaga sp.]